MTKILEFTPSQEDAITARVLVMVHRAVDQHFPNTTQPSRQFTKTVFSDDQETTAIRSIAAPADPDNVPPPPPAPPPPASQATIERQKQARPATTEDGEYELPNMERDWYSIGATVLLAIGLLALAYVISQN